MPLADGARVGPYIVEGVIGIGADHLTYRAVRADTGRVLALKEFKPAGRMIRADDGETLLTRDPAERAAFAKLAAEVAAQARGRERFRHPNVIAILDAVLQNGTAYLGMDRYPGRPLSELLDQGETLDRNEIDEILPPLLDGLEALHEDGLLHLDLSPASIFVRRDGRPMLGRGSLYPAGRRAEGGPFVLDDEDGYLAEEHLFPELGLGPWSDIYGLSATFYRLAAGAPPANVIKRIKETTRSRPDPVAEGLEALRAAWHDEFLSTLEGGLALASEDRIASVRAFRDRLTRGAAVDRKRAANDHRAAVEPPAEDGPPTVRVIRGGASTAAAPAPASLLLRSSGRVAEPAPARPVLRLYRGGKEVVEPAPPPDSRAPKPAVSRAAPTEDEVLSARFTMFAPTPDAARWSDACVYLHEPGLETTVRRHFEDSVAGRRAEAPRPRDAAQLALTPGAPIAIVPETETIAVNPIRAAVAWHETFHRVDFRLRLSDPAARPLEMIDRLLFFVGPILAGEAPLMQDDGEGCGPAMGTTSRGFTRIYVCHALDDGFVSSAIDAAVRHLRMPFLGASAALRAKREWDREIFRQIERADVFLLYWSATAAASARLRKEWDFAANLDRDRFVRVIRHRDDDTPPPPDLAHAPRHRLWV